VPCAGVWTAFADRVKTHGKALRLKAKTHGLTAKPPKPPAGQPTRALENTLVN